MTDPTRAKHTPGRLYVSGHTLHTANDALWIVCQTDPERPRKQLYAELEHLAACWNACEGMADPEADVAALVKAAQAVFACVDKPGKGEFAVTSKLMVGLQIALARVTGGRK